MVSNEECIIPECLLQLEFFLDGKGSVYSNCHQMAVLAMGDMVPYWGQRARLCCWQIGHSAIELRKRIYICVTVTCKNPFDKDKNLIITLYWFWICAPSRGHTSGWESLLFFFLILSSLAKNSFVKLYHFKRSVFSKRK